MAEKTATIMARELNYNDTWKANQIQSFRKLAQQYAAPAQ
jgi:hypothetical protein